MTYCSKKDLCYNYPLKCDYCISFSDCMSDTPLFQDKDLVEVVRCKDCKLRYTEGCPFMSWDCSGELMGDNEDNDFCSYGERKE